MARARNADAGTIGEGTPVRVTGRTVSPSSATPSAGTGGGLDALPRGLLHVSLFLLVVTVIGRAHDFIPGLAGVEPVMLLILAAAAGMAMHPERLDWRQPLRRWPARVMIALFAFAIVAAPFGIHPLGSLSSTVNQYGKILVIAFLVLFAIRRTSNLYSFVWAHVGATAVLIWGALFVHELQVYSDVSRLGDLGMYDSNDLGCVLATSVPLVMLAYESTRGRVGKIVAGAVLLAAAVALARTGSRGGFVGILVVTAALLWTMHHVAVWKRVVVVLVGFAGLQVAAPQGYWERMESLTEVTEDYNWTDYYGRRQVAKRGFGYMMDNPFFGVGMGNFGRADATLAEEADIAGHNKWRAPHNSFVQVGAELGIPGLILWSSLVLGGMVSLFRIRKRLPRSWLQGGHERRFLYLFSVYMPVTLLGFAATSFFLSFAYLAPVYLLAAMLCGYFVCLRNHFRREAHG